MQQDIIIQPAELLIQLNKSTTGQLNLSNVTLHQIAIKLFSSDPDKYNIIPNQIILGSFDTTKINISVNINQQSKKRVDKLNNFEKLFVFQYKTEQFPKQAWNNQGLDVSYLKYIQNSEVKIVQKVIDQDDENQKNQQKVSDLIYIKVNKIIGKKQTSQQLKNQIFQYIQKLGTLQNIQSKKDGEYIAKLKKLHNNIQLPILKQFLIKQNVSIFTIGQTFVFENKKIQCKQQLEKQKDVINLNDNLQEKQADISSQIVEKQQYQQNINIKKQNQEQIKQQIIQKIVYIKKQQESAHFQVNNADHNDFHTHKAKKQNFQSFAVAKDTKKSFANSKKRKRNKSLQLKNKVSIEQQSEQIQQGEEQEQISKKQITDLIKQHLIQAQNINRHSEQKLQQATKQMQQPRPMLINHSVINCIIQPLALCFSEERGYFYILFQNFLQIYNITDKLLPLRKIQIEKISYQIGKKIIMKQYNYKIVIAIDSYFYIIDLDTQCYQWTYVQRKQIFDFTLIKNLQLLAIGGRNFSKLAYFGKQTNRSNLKIYQFNDHYKHIYTYDIQNAGDITTVHYLVINQKPIIFVFGRKQQQQTLFLIKPIDWDKYQIIGKFQLQQLGIKDIKNFKFSKKHIYAVQTLLVSPNKISVIKRFSINLQEDKKNINRPTLLTQSISTSQLLYNYFENDQDTLILYSISQSQLRIVEGQPNKKNIHRFKLQKGFRSLKVQLPYIFLIQDTQIYIQRLVFD